MKIKKVIIQILACVLAVFAAAFVGVAFDNQAVSTTITAIVFALICGAVSVKLFIASAKTKAKEKEKEKEKGKSDVAPTEKEEDSSTNTVLENPVQKTDKQEDEKALPYIKVPEIKVVFDFGDLGKDDDFGINLYKASDRDVLHLQHYFVLDVETTGLDRKNDKIVEIAWQEYDNGVKLSEYTTLVNPEMHISMSATKVNNIHDYDVIDAPKYADINNLVYKTLVDKTVIGHNIQFDLAFIKRMMGSVEGRIVYIDTVTLSKKVFPGLNSYKLQDLCKSLNLPVESSHRALNDVSATYELFKKCQNELIRRDAEEKAKKKEEREREKARRKEQYGNSSLFDVSFVYTGNFSIDRQKMMNMAISVGAFARQSVSGKTDYLVVGDVSTFPGWALDRKLNKAKAMQENGGKIKIIGEKEYFDLIKSAQ